MWLLTKKMMREPSHKIAFTIPVSEPLPPQYYIHATSDEWLAAEAWLPISFKDIILPEKHPPNTELLPLQPLPVTALNNPVYESMYTRFKYLWGEELSEPHFRRSFCALPSINSAFLAPATRSRRRPSTPSITLTPTCSSGRPLGLARRSQASLRSCAPSPTTRGRR